MTFEYDYMNRRVRKQVFAWNGTSWNTTPDEDWRFVYDGWNVVEVLNAAGEPQQKYTWGLDLSGLAGVVQASVPASGIHGADGTLDTLGERQGQVGGLHGAGGIGGLLAREEPQAVGDPKRHCYLYDANGNVGQLLKYAAGPPPTVSLAAHYEYDPYGNTIRKDDVDQSGIVDANPYRFSTKWFDSETDLYYYGYRYYSPRMERWLSRDPIEEADGPNVLVFVLNHPTFDVDVDGSQSLGRPKPPPPPPRRGQPPSKDRRKWCYPRCVPTYNKCLTCATRKYAGTGAKGDQACRDSLRACLRGCKSTGNTSHAGLELKDCPAKCCPPTGSGSGGSPPVPQPVEIVITVAGTQVYAVGELAGGCGVFSDVLRTQICNSYQAYVRSHINDNKWDCDDDPECIYLYILFQQARCKE